MPDKSETEMKMWRISFALISATGFLCLVWFLGSPSESSSAFLFGYSLPRILLALILLFPSLLFAALLIPRFGQAVRNVDGFLDMQAKRPFFFLLIWIGLLGLAILWTLFFLSERLAIQWFGFISLYISVAKPIWLFGIVFIVAGLVHALNAKYKLSTKTLLAENKTIRLSLIIFFVFVALAGAIAFSGIGLGFDATVWNAPGTPILINQAVFVIAISILSLGTLLWLGYRFKTLQKPGSSVFLDLGLAALIWILTIICWLEQPAPSTYYDTPPQPPNFQPYPLSDAFNHDVIANNVLIGEGFRFGGHIAIRRPVYTLFLAGVESLLGGNYDAVIAAQVVVLALFPVFLFLLGTKMHSRFAGLLLAGFVIFRESNSIVLGDVINTSHAKLLMADLPTALMISGFALAAFVWLQGASENKLAPLLVGGLLGWAILLRSQSLTLLPFILLLAFLVWGLKKVWKPVLLFLLGVILVASPWIVRNRVLMGQWAIEDAVVSGFLANRYSFTPGTFGLPFLSGESEGDYYARQMAHVRDFAIQNPGYVAGFVVDNFVRNELLNFLATPLSLQLRDLESHVRDLPYWPGWEGRLNPESYLPMAASLVLISIGIAAAWKRFRFLGLLPLSINAGFTLNLALARVSGWRYNLPVDWTILFYYAIGISQVFIWGFLLAKSRALASKAFGISRDTGIVKPGSKKHQLYANAYLFIAIFSLLLLSSSFLIIETLSHPRYRTIAPAAAASVISSASLDVQANAEEQQTMIDLVTSGRARAHTGRALYPRYYRSGDGEPGRDFILIDPMDFERITFYLIGPNPASVVLRVNSPDLDFPSGSDVLVLRCSSSSEAAAVVVMDEDGGKLYISPDLSESCPATTP